MTDMPFSPNWTVHPGELVEMFMEDLGIDNKELARRMGVAEQFVEEMRKADEGMSFGTTVIQKLAKAFDMSEEFWHNAETEYRQDLIRLTPGRVGLFNNWESFQKVDSKMALIIAKQAIESLIAQENEYAQQLGRALQSKNTFTVLVEIYKGVDYWEFKIDDSEPGINVAFGPSMMKKIMKQATSPSGHSAYNYVHA